ncbi:hypothetical protein [Streptomyces sp. NRRL F-2664]|uniref:hypothetical protein n=1 Tax=Streptomyces sp. NRRL F-2664 TaxID=1463842 RepID=UPI0004C52257|nr:hypothetical protein [Streptomyces sp. NRRL F-2664]
MKLMSGRRARRRRRRRALARLRPRAVLLRIGGRLGRWFGRRLTVWSLRLTWWGARRVLRRVLRALLLLAPR